MKGWMVLLGLSWVALALNLWQPQLEMQQAFWGSLILAAIMKEGDDAA